MDERDTPHSLCGLSGQDDLLFDLVRTLTATIELRDRYTTGHSRNVARVARVLAAEYGMSAAEQDRVELTGLLHDIGKIVVPEDILNKTSRLSIPEYREIQKHSRAGADIIRGLDNLADLLPGMLHHHERFDGRGYPDRLPGKDIPVLARLITVADTYDALTSDRAYHKGLSPRLAAEEIEKCTGSQFDPEMVLLFMRAYNKGALDPAPSAD